MFPVPNSRHVPHPVCPDSPLENIYSLQNTAGSTVNPIGDRGKITISAKIDLVRDLELKEKKSTGTVTTLTQSISRRNAKFVIALGLFKELHPHIPNEW